jgi:hypothetical protein
MVVQVEKQSILLQEAMSGGHCEGLQGTILEMMRRLAMAGGDKITVLNPMGYPPTVTHKPLAPRLETLDGKTVYLVDCRFDDADIFLKQVQAWFAEHMPSVRTVFKPISSVYTRDDPATWEEIKARGDAAIIGVGH